MRIAQTIHLSEEESKILGSWSRGRSAANRLVKRAKIVLMAAAGKQNKTIAELLEIDPLQVARWRIRFAEKRLPGIEKDAPRGGRKSTKRDQVAQVIIETTTQKKPENATHWSVRCVI